MDRNQKQIYAIRNEWLSLQAVLSEGGKNFNLFSLTDNGHRQWIFHQFCEMQIEEQNYDCQYFGGMEFIFPNDETEVFEGKEYGDHGLLWRMSYRVETGQNCITAVSEDDLLIHAEYKVSLKKNQLKIACLIRNLGKESIPYLIRFHPSFLLEETDQLHLFGKRIIFEEPKGKYCSFEIQENNLKKIRTKEQQDLYLEDPKTWEQHDIFFHLEQKAGKFEIDKGNVKLKCSYSMEDFPYLTCYSFVNKDDKRIAIIEPASGCGANFQMIEKQQSLRYFNPLEEKILTICMEIE